ncbi:Cytosolic Fe-S cluster assembly factor NUBP2 like protein [Dictyocoela muelleri]|nr:Cytosolic Fe-S cluster assembly factor NUBP2 like protein [Dictyocoela muelleri]
MKKIAVMSGKGGVGKTTVAVSLSHLCSKYGKTLFIDFDLSGPSTKIAFGVNGKITKKEKGLAPIVVTENLHVLSMAFMQRDGDCIAWRAPKKLNVCKMFIDSFESDDSDYKYVIFDMPPGIGFEHEFVGNSDVILVTTSQNVALSDLDRMYDFLMNRKMNVLGVIENMSGFKCENCGQNMNIFSKNGGRLFSEAKGIPFLGCIEFDISISYSLDNGEIGGNEKILNKLEKFFIQMLLKTRH